MGEGKELTLSEVFDAAWGYFVLCQVTGRDAAGRAEKFVILSKHASGVSAKRELGYVGIWYFVGQGYPFGGKCSLEGSAMGNGNRLPCKIYFWSVGYDAEQIRGSWGILQFQDGSYGKGAEILRESGIVFWGRWESFSYRGSPSD